MKGEGIGDEKWNGAGRNAHEEGWNLVLGIYGCIHNYNKCYHMINNCKQYFQINRGFPVLAFGPCRAYHYPSQSEAV